MDTYAQKRHREIQEKIEWLVDDNHVCVSIMNDENSVPADIWEAKARLSANREEIARLVDEDNGLQSNIH